MLYRYQNNESHNCEICNSDLSFLQDERGGENVNPTDTRHDIITSTPLFIIRTFHIQLLSRFFQSPRCGAADAETEVPLLLSLVKREVPWERHITGLANSNGTIIHAKQSYSQLIGLLDDQGLVPRGLAILLSASLLADCRESSDYCFSACLLGPVLLECCQLRLTSLPNLI